MPISQNTLIYILIGISFLLIVVSAFFNARRYNNIYSLPTSVISKATKKENLEKLKMNRYGFYIAAGLNVVNMLLPNGLLKFAIPAITIIFTTTVLISLFEEIDTFNVTKGEVDLMNDFHTKRKEEVLMKAKQRERDELNRLEAEKNENAKSKSDKE